ncbi:Os12g0131266, partial [Oryza sativa Japonica Group]
RRRRSSGELRQLQRRISGKGTPTYSSSSSSSTVPVRSTRPRRRGRRPAVSASDCLLSRRIRGQIDGGHVGGRLPAGAQGGAEARRRGDSKKHFREFVASEFRRPTGTDADARARLRLAGDYAYLLASVHHHKDLLFSYNIAVDRSEEMKKILNKSAASVGLQLPDVYQA